MSIKFQAAPAATTDNCAFCGCSHGDSDSHNDPGGFQTLAGGNTLLPSLADLSLVDESGDAPASTSTTASMEVGGVFIGEIGTSGDVDWVRIELEAGRAYQIDMVDSDGARTTLADPLLGGVFNSTGARVADEDDDSGPRSSARILFEPETSGAYFIDAQAFVDTGSYALSVRDIGFAAGVDYRDTIDTLAEALVSQSFISAIEQQGDVDYIAVELVGGTDYQIDIFGAFYDTGLSLVDPILLGVFDDQGGAFSDTERDDGGSVFNSRLIFSAPSTGTYFLSVGQSGQSADDTGTYEVLVREVLPDVPVTDDLPDSVDTAETAPLLSVGDSLTGGMNTPSDVDIVRVSLVAGQPVALSMTRGNGGLNREIDDPNITAVYDPNGNLIPLAFNDDAGPGLNARLTFEPDETGIYFVELEHASGNGLGSYTFAVEAADPSTDGLPIGPTNPDTFGLRDEAPTSSDPLIQPLVSSFRHAETPGLKPGEILLTYSFSNELSRYANNYPEGGPNDFIYALTQGQEDFARDAFDQMSAFLPITFLEVADRDDSAGIFRFAFTAEENNDAAAFAYFPSSSQSGSDVFFITGNIADTDASGSFFHVAVLHEIGHAMGLTHPFLDNPDSQAEVVAEDQFDSFAWTVMANQTRLENGEESTFATLYPTSYMYLDILALQHKYGAIEARTGGDTYVFDGSTRYFETLWDTGGIDAIRVTNQDKGVTLRLTPGSWLDVGTEIDLFQGGVLAEVRTETVYVPEEITIENAFGDAGDDIIEGNDVANFLVGGIGNDTVLGGAGNDQIFAGTDDDGDDLAIGEAGNDIVAGGAGNDLLVGDGVNSRALIDGVMHISADTADGSDIGFGGAGNDTLIGGGWIDSNNNGRFEDGEESAGLQLDVLYAGTGDDLVIGSAAGDTLGGGTGNDELRGGDGDDVFYGGQGDANSVGQNDVILAGAGNDIAFASGGDDSVDGAAGDDQLFGGGGADTLSGGGGGDTLFSGGGDDQLTGGSGSDIFSYNSAVGDSVITDFTIGQDILRLAQTVTNFTSVTDVIAASQSTSRAGVAGVSIDLGGGSSVFLQGLSLQDLQSVDFVF